jgi:large subunit ribosomal protein L9
MKLILTENVEKLGKAGELVDVKDGYGRNYLIPQGKAFMATSGSIRDYKEKERQAALKLQQNEEVAKELAAELDETTITIPVTAGEEGKIHGTVTTQQIADALQEKDIVVDKRNIEINEDVNALGEYTATVAISAKYKPTLKVWVVKAD